MGLAMTANMVLVAVNAAMLLGITILYLRTLRQVRSTFTLGLTLFALLLLVQNLVQLYFYVTMMPYFVGTVENLVLVQNVLTTFAVGFLAYVTFFPATGRREAKTPEIGA